MSGVATIFGAPVQEPTEKAIKATITRIVWQKGSRIIAIAQPQGGKEISILGDLLQPVVGQLYEFTGNWKRNEQYNRWELRFTSYRTILPDNDTGIYHYLVRTAKWVGPETAEALIERYGGQVLDVLKNDPMRVMADQIPLLTPERIDELSKSLKQNEALEAAMIEVNGLCGGLVGQSTAEKAIKKWGADAGKVIKRNPFRLTEIHGIGFVKADTVFQKLYQCGGEPLPDRRQDALHRRRQSSAVLHALTEAAGREGHTQVSQLRLIADSQKLSGHLRPEILPMCLRAGVLKADQSGGLLAHHSLARAEQVIAEKLLLLATQQLPELPVSEDLKPLIESLQDDQLEAFEMSRRSPLFIVTGAPGTGKTYTIARIIALWKSVGLKIALAAPTGKAAKQMQLALQQTVGSPAQTIHSLLEAAVSDEGEFGFGRDDRNPLECNAIVIDEASMVDVSLGASLLRALPNECRVLIVGDHYQLPSVGPGAVLRDMLRANLPSVELKKIKRNAGCIIQSCHAIKDGRMPTPSAKLVPETGDNWRHIQAGSVPEILSLIEQLLISKLQSLGIDRFWGAQIISPTNETGEISCKTLNRIAKGIINPGETSGKLPFGVGDKIVCTKNCQLRTPGAQSCAACLGSGKVGLGTDLNGERKECTVCNGVGVHGGASSIHRVVNGDLGVVCEVGEKKLIMEFKWPTRRVEVSRTEHNCRLAYAMTCHKMQGSEVDVVILPIRKSMMQLPMVTREWLYTAFSRPKKFLLTIGDLSHVPQAIAKIGNAARSTSLAERLHNLGF